MVLFSDNKLDVVERVTGKKCILRSCVLSKISTYIKTWLEECRQRTKYPKLVTVLQLLIVWRSLPISGGLRHCMAWQSRLESISEEMYVLLGRDLLLGRLRCCVHVFIHAGTSSHFFPTSDWIGCNIQHVNTWYLMVQLVNASYR